MGEYYRFSKGIFSWVGFNTKYIPYVAEERKSGKSSFNFSKLLKYGLDGIIAFSTMPLKNFKLYRWTDGIFKPCLCNNYRYKKACKQY